MEIFKRNDDTKGVVVLPRRWVVERTFSWFGRNRCFAKDFESPAKTLTPLITIAAMRLWSLLTGFLRRLSTPISTNVVDNSCITP
jgi:hypothetical protein